MVDPKISIGQLLFGHPPHSYDVPEIWEAALDAVNAEIERVWFNERQAAVSGPMRNYAARYDCEVFSAHAYDWDNEDQPWNFKWRDVRIRWYKRCGSGMTANMPLTPDMAAEMLTECLAAIRAGEAV